MRDYRIRKIATTRGLRKGRPTGGRARARRFVTNDRKFQCIQRGFGEVPEPLTLCYHARAF